MWAVVFPEWNDRTVHIINDCKKQELGAPQIFSKLEVTDLGRLFQKLNVSCFIHPQTSFNVCLGCHVVTPIGVQILTI